MTKPIYIKPAPSTLIPGYALALAVRDAAKLALVTRLVLGGTYR